MSHNIKQIQKPKPLKIYGRSHYACTRCKLSKIKCSGEKPACSNCKNINKSDECIYPSKDRKIVIMESDLNKLHEKVQELENTIEVLQKHDIDTPNNNFNLKFCQFFFENTFENFEIQLYLLKKCLNNMPEKSYSLILIEKVYCTYNQEFYLIDLNEVNQLVDKVYELAHQFSNQLEINIEITQMSLCYFFILIAFGEQLLNISSNITGSTEELINSYPGIEYYQYAEHLFRLTRRNNDMTFVQCAILLGLYSANLARYTTVGNYFGVAARSAVSQGYHRHREHSSQCSSASEQVKATNEKIKRLWWTVFVIDTTWCTKTVHFQYTDTDVNLPCENIYDLGDFFDLNTLELNVHLTKYVAKFIRLIFGPNIRTFSINYINTDDFNQNQQLKNIVNASRDLIENFEFTCLLNLKKIDYLNINRNLANLLLRYHQLIILITKPLLTLILGSNPTIRQNYDDIQKTIAKGIFTSCATIDIISRCYTNNKIFMLGYWDSQHLFAGISLLIICCMNNLYFPQLNRGVALLKFMASMGNINANNRMKYLYEINETLSKFITLDLSSIDVENTLFDTNDYYSSSEFDENDTENGDKEFESGDGYNAVDLVSYLPTKYTRTIKTIDKFHIDEKISGNDEYKDFYIFLINHIQGWND